MCFIQYTRARVATSWTYSACSGGRKEDEREQEEEEAEDAEEEEDAEVELFIG